MTRSEDRAVLIAQRARGFLGPQGGAGLCARAGESADAVLRAWHEGAGVSAEATREMADAVLDAGLGLGEADFRAKVEAAFDESKHKRDGGKFSTNEGAGKTEEGASDADTPEASVETWQAVWDKVGVKDEAGIDSTLEKVGQKEGKDAGEVTPNDVLKHASPTPGGGGESEGDGPVGGKFAQPGAPPPPKVSDASDEDLAELAKLHEERYKRNPAAREKIKEDLMEVWGEQKRRGGAKAEASQAGPPTTEYVYKRKGE